MIDRFQLDSLPARLFIVGLAVMTCAAAQVGDRPPSTLRGNRALVIAHRGGAREFTENTIAAFRRAIKIGADGIETDLRLTKDGRVVLYHDNYFGRVEGLAAPQRTRLISDMTYAELAAQSLERVGEDPGGSRVPTLDDLLKDLSGGLLNLELKRAARFDELIDASIRILKGFPDLDRAVLEPPDLKTAERLRAAVGPRLKLHINPAFDSSVPYELALERVLKFKPHSISVSYGKVSWDVVEAAHKAGVEVWVYTVDSPEIARAMLLLGVDAVKTDRPTMLVDLVNNRGSYRK